MNENEFGTVTQEREPLPTFDPQPQQPMYAAPVQPVVQPVLTGEAAVSQVVDSAFGKGLAATIMAWMPFTSIVSIILGAVALKGVKRAQALAASFGIGAGGKNVAARVLGLVGLISGIAMTAFWSLYFFIILIIIFAGNAAF